MSRYRVYPLLAAMYAVLHVAAANVGEWTRLSDLPSRLVIAIGAAGTAWLAAVCRR